MADKPNPPARRVPPSTPTAQAAPAAAATKPAGAGEDWGVPAPRTGIRGEVKLALMFVITLGCTFGYIVHRKFDALRQHLVAGEDPDIKSFRPLAEGQKGAQEVDLFAPPEQAEPEPSGAEPAPAAPVRAAAPENAIAARAAQVEPQLPLLSWDSSEGANPPQRTPAAATANTGAPASASSDPRPLTVQPARLITASDEPSGPAGSTGASTPAPAGASENELFSLFSEEPPAQTAEPAAPVTAPPASAAPVTAALPQTPPVVSPPAQESEELLWSSAPPRTAAATPGPANDFPTPHEFPAGNGSSTVNAIPATPRLPGSSIDAPGDAGTSDPFGPAGAASPSGPPEQAEPFLADAPAPLTPPAREPPAVLPTPSIESPTAPSVTPFPAAAAQSPTASGPDDPFAPQAAASSSAAPMVITAESTGSRMIETPPAQPFPTAAGSEEVFLPPVTRSPASDSNPAQPAPATAPSFEPGWQEPAPTFAPAPDAFPPSNAASDVRTPEAAPSPEFAPQPLLTQQINTVPAEAAVQNDPFPAQRPAASQPTAPIVTSAAPAPPQSRLESDRFAPVRPRADAAPRNDDPFAATPPPQRAVSEIIYTVRPGDSYWTIARQHYGSAQYVAPLAEYNRRQVPNPERLRPGEQVLVPHPEILESRYPNLFQAQAAAAPGAPVTAAAPRQPGPNAEGAPGQFFVSPDGQPMYRIGKGDTLSSIAQKHLGRSSRWEQIYRMNQDVLGSPDSLKLGVELRLPHDASQVALTPDAPASR